VGSAQDLIALAESLGQRWLKGIRLAVRLGWVITDLQKGYGCPKGRIRRGRRDFYRGLQGLI
jgi:hypothetical protein